MLPVIIIISPQIPVENPGGPQSQGRRIDLKAQFMAVESTYLDVEKGSTDCSIEIKLHIKLYPPVLIHPDICIHRMF